MDNRGYTLGVDGRLVELADTPDLGSGAARRRGSTPRVTTRFLSVFTLKTAFS